MTCPRDLYQLRTGISADGKSPTAVGIKTGGRSGVKSYLNPGPENYHSF
jgi:hypothetical protein